jgi:hypothetical protein
MAKEFIGVIIGANSGQIYAVINPDDDSELDNPRLLLLQGGPPQYKLADMSNLTRVDDRIDVPALFEMAPDQPVTREPMRMVKVSRGDYMVALSMQDVTRIIAELSR